MSDRKIILIVEDENDTRVELCNFLRSKGFECQAFMDGEKALNNFKGPYDLALLDMHLPGMNGFEVFKRLKEKQANLPAIMITAFGDYETWGRSLDKGFLDIIPKPYDFEELLRNIERWIDGAQKNHPKPSSDSAKI